MASDDVELGGHSDHRRRRRKKSSRRRTLGCFLMLVLLVVVASGVTFVVFELSSTLSSEPLPNEVLETPTKEQSERFANLLRRHNPAELKEDETGRVELTEPDVNAITALFAPPEPDMRMQVLFRNGRFQARLSVPTRSTPFGSWLNFVVDFVADGVERETNVGVLAMLIGENTVPPWLATRLTERTIDRWRRQGKFDRFYDLVQSFETRDEKVEITYRKGELPEGLRQVIGAQSLRPKPSPEATREYLTFLLTEPRTDRDSCFRALFGEVAKRSGSTGRPVSEVQAALVALALRAGHVALETKADVLLTVDEKRQIERQPLGFQLAEREELFAKYIWGAATAILEGGDSALDQAIEFEVRATMTDKGLSYLRILAVEAGIALADTASAGQDKAKAMQEELSAKGFLEDAHFPTFVEEFPEGIKASEFRTHYGGEKGPRHLRMMHDVEQAVKKCPAYR